MTNNVPHPCGPRNLGGPKPLPDRKLAWQIRIPQKKIKHYGCLL
jgi:hypothetical protein